jgi:hypothetical protein
MAILVMEKQLFLDDLPISILFQNDDLPIPGWTSTSSTFWTLDPWPKSRNMPLLSRNIALTVLWISFYRFHHRFIGADVRAVAGKMLAVHGCGMLFKTGGATKFVTFSPPEP